jgi:valyl-tRNA synthetase
VIPFVSEALWQALTSGESLVIADWPDSSGVALDTVAAQRITDMQKLVTEIRRFRSDQGLADRQKVPARLSGIDTADLTTQVGAVTSLAWLTDAAPEFTASASLEVGLKGGIVVVELDTSGTIDVAAERRRLEKDLAAAQKELASTTAKLGNADFMAKAPEAVVDKQRERQRLAREEADRITARLAGLK